jgi:hypothetical protein
MPTYDVHYGNRRTAIVLKADLMQGWRPLQQTYGFNDQRLIPYRDDMSIRAQLTVIAQPATFAEWASQFPDVELEIADPDARCSFQNRKLAVTIPMTSQQRCWRLTPQGRPEIFIEHLIFLAVDQTRWFDLRAWIVFRETPHHPIPDVRVWVENALLVPGGQVESSRRRH